MKPRTISVPTLALIGSTRGMLGAGIGLLLATRLSEARRLGVGRALLAIGLLSTIPLALRVFRSRPEEPRPAMATTPVLSEEPLRRGRHQMMPIAMPGMLDARHS